MQGCTNLKTYFKNLWESLTPTPNPIPVSSQQLHEAFLRFLFFRLKGCMSLNGEHIEEEKITTIILPYSISVAISSIPICSSNPVTALKCNGSGAFSTSLRCFISTITATTHPNNMVLLDIFVADSWCSTSMQNESMGHIFCWEHGPTNSLTKMHVKLRAGKQNNKNEKVNVFLNSNYS